MKSMQRKEAQTPSTVLWKCFLICGSTATSQVCTQSDFTRGFCEMMTSVLTLLPDNTSESCHALSHEQSKSQTSVMVLPLVRLRADRSVIALFFLVNANWWNSSRRPGLWQPVEARAARPPQNLLANSPIHSQSLEWWAIITRTCQTTEDLPDSATHSMCGIHVTRVGRRQKKWIFNGLGLR